MKTIVALLTLLLIAAGCKVEKKGEFKMSSSDGEAITYCLGRTILDLPKDFDPSPTTTGQFKEAGLSDDAEELDVMIKHASLTQQQFSAEIAKRRKEIVDFSGPRVDVLRFEKKLSDRAVLFRVQRIDDAYVSELLTFLEGALVRLQVNSYEDKFVEAEDRLAKFASRLAGKREKGLASGAEGFCLGPVLLTGDFKEENASFYFRDSEGSSFTITIDTYGDDADDGLLSRVAGPDSLLTKLSVHHRVLRARERTVAGMRAQEWLGLAQIGEHSDDKAFAFTAETMRANPGKASPSIHLSFDTRQPRPDGAPPKTLMSEKKALELWDSVVESIHPIR